MFLTYILGVAWLGVFGFSAVPVFLFYNMWSTCATMRSTMANLTDIDSICVDVRQYGKTTTQETGLFGVFHFKIINKIFSVELTSSRLYKLRCLTFDL